jgi:hypothetical protein
VVEPFGGAMGRSERPRSHHRPEEMAHCDGGSHHAEIGGLRISLPSGQFGPPCDTSRAPIAAHGLNAIHGTLLWQLSNAANPNSTSRMLSVVLIYEKSRNMA